jgi:hypothetical protein
VPRDSVDFRPPTLTRLGHRSVAHHAIISKKYLGQVAASQDTLKHLLHEILLQLKALHVHWCL